MRQDMASTLPSARQVTDESLSMPCECSPEQVLCDRSNHLCLPWICVREGVLLLLLQMLVVQEEHIVCETCSRRI